MFKNYLDKIGFAGSFFTLLCCLGFGPLIALITALGVGFIVNDAVLAPLLVVFLIVGGIGLYATKKRHNHSGPLRVHIASGVSVLVFTFAFYVNILLWLGIAGLLSASVWNYFLGRRAGQS